MMIYDVRAVQAHDKMLDRHFKAFDKATSGQPAKRNRKPSVRVGSGEGLGGICDGCGLEKSRLTPVSGAPAVGVYLCDECLVPVPDPRRMFCAQCHRGPLFSWERGIEGFCVECRPPNNQASERA